MAAVVEELSTACVFPGQGTQRIGMAKWILHRSPLGRDLLHHAQLVLGRDLGALMARGPADILQRTDNAQVAIFVADLAAYDVVVRAGIRPVAYAGHSVGELAAACAAGAIDCDDGLRLVARRGQIMAAIAERGAMAAVIGLEPDAVERLCRDVDPTGRLVVGLDNAPRSQVISGPRDAVHMACDRAVGLGAKRVVPLATANAFHSPLMDAALEEWHEALGRIAIESPSAPIALNATGTLTSDAAAIRSGLFHQMNHRVRWSDCVSALAACATRTVECGDSRALSALVRESAPDVRTISMATPEGLRELRGPLANAMDAVPVP